MLFEVYQVLLIVSLIIVFFTSNKKWEYDLPKFKIFIIVVCLAELIFGKYFKYFHGNNLIVFNIFFIFCIIYYSYTFLVDKINVKNKNIFVVLLISWTIFAISNFLCIQGVWNLNTITWSSGIVLVFGIVINYYLTLLKSEEILDLRFNEKFILTIGILGVYSTSFPLIVWLNKIHASNSFIITTQLNLVKFGNIILATSYLYIALCPILKQHWSKK